jgi:SAM-dependent MidA family methyltransferase
MGIGWRLAMESALYGPAGFFVRDGASPADHFRTSVHASPLLAAALVELIRRVDTALEHPDPFQIVDVGAGRGELLSALAAHLTREESLRRRVELTGVEKARRPDGLSAAIGWRRSMPDEVTGLLIATEWLDNVPVDVAEVDDDGRLRRVLVDRATGAETLGAAVDAADRMWLSRWWPAGTPGSRAEVGWPRDAAWAGAVESVRRGCALAIDYGHRKADRPWAGTLTGFRDGRQVEPVPDGSCDVTAHVAIDSVASAAGTPYTLVSQRAGLKALGVHGGRPPLELARTDPAAYLRALSAAGAAAELTDPDGLGGHWWLLHTAGIQARGIISA